MKAPVFTLPTIDLADQYTLEKDLGKIVIITFWTSWCPDCAKDLPKKEQLFQSIDPDKVKMITINVSGRERNRDDGLAYYNKFLKQETLADCGKEVYDLYHCQGVPTTVIIDSSGNIFKQFGDSANFLDIVKAIGVLINN